MKSSGCDTLAHLSLNQPHSSAQWPHVAHGRCGGRHSRKYLPVLISQSPRALLGEPGKHSHMPRRIPCVIPKPLMDNEQNEKTNIRYSRSHHHTFIVERLMGWRQLWLALLQAERALACGPQLQWCLGRRPSSCEPQADPRPQNSVRKAEPCPGLTPTLSVGESLTLAQRPRWCLSAACCDALEEGASPTPHPKHRPAHVCLSSGGFQHMEGGTGC